MQDRYSIALLLMLYTLQGCILGFFSYTLQLIFAEKKVSLSQLTPLSFIAYPYTIKILFAPFLDEYYSSKMGKRKSYIIPTQYLVSIIFLFCSFNIQDFIDQQQIYMIASIGSVLCFLISLQDIAVDAWAIKLLSEKNISYSASCQSVGISVGGLISTSLYFQFYKKSWFFSMNVFNAGTYFCILGVGLLLFTIFLHFFVKEDACNDVEKSIKAQEGKELLQENDINQQLKVSSDSTQPNDKKRLLQIYSVFVCFFSNPYLRYMMLFVLFDRVGFAPINAAYSIKLVQQGVPKEQLSYINTINSPLKIIFPLILSAYLKKIMKLSSLSYLMIIKLFLQALCWYLLQQSGQDIIQNYFLYALLVFSFILENWFYTYFVMVRMVFANQIAAQGVEGTYITAFTSLNNIGRKFSESLFFAISDVVNFTAITFVGWTYAIIFILFTKKKLLMLSKLEKSEWKINQKKEQ